MSRFKESDTPVSEKTLKARRALAIGGLSVAGVLILGFVLLRSSSSMPQAKKEAAKVVTPDTLISDQEKWVDRLSHDYAKVQKELESLKDENKEIKARNTLLEKRQEMTDAVLKGATASSSYLSQGKISLPAQKGVSSEAVPGAGMFPALPAESQARSRPPVPSAPLASRSSYPEKREGPRLLHLTRGGPVPEMPKTVESYVPAGTYVSGILTSGVVASTSTEAQGNPMPIMVRLAGRGTLPRGFKSDLKDAVLMGSCYGDLSSERALCRLHKLSLTERNGEIFESPVEGWIMGEDGRPGLKGDVVDRAGKVAREALAAGILSGMAGFFQQQASSSYSPATLVSPQKRLETGDVLKGGAAGGAGNALEKLADFSIRRAEQMQPVILVASGRRVDVVFKEGIDLSKTVTRQELKLAGQDGRLKQAKEQARQTFGGTS